MARISELEDRLNKNSQNSNKPPSSDGLRKKPVSKPAFPRKKGKKTGGQYGHTGKTLEMSATPDEEIYHLPSHCGGCGSILLVEEGELLERRQVFELPDPKLKIIEHQRLGCNCGRCGEHNEGYFPETVKASVQYGVGVRSLVVLLNVAFKMPLRKIQQLIGDLYGYSINESTIVDAVKRCHEGLESTEQAIKKGVLQSIVAHFDETGLRVEGKLHWLHTAGTTLLTYFFVHAKRGKEALWDTVSLLPQFTNWAIHDCWTSYFKFSDCQHGLCGAHILRELTALQEKQTPWASWFKRYLLTLYHMSNKGTTALNAVQQKKALSLFDEIWANADRIEPPPQKSPSKRGRPKATKGRNLLTRFAEHRQALLAFALHEHVPFTNNLAERDLRPAKTKQKISGSFRTLRGAQHYARIFGFISSARKNQLSVFEQIKAAFTGDTFFTQQRPAK